MEVSIKIVLIGEHTRDHASDVELVNNIIDMCKSKYGKFRIITKDTNRGVGKLVRNRLTDTNNKPKEVDWTELYIKHHLVTGDLPRVEFSADYDALNSALVEIGDEFHILGEYKPRGVTMNLLRRVKQENRSFALYKPGETQAQEAKFPDKEMK